MVKKNKNIRPKKGLYILFVTSSCFGLFLLVSLITSKLSIIYKLKYFQQNTNLFLSISVNMYILWGGIALMIGWLLFNNKFREKNFVLDSIFSNLYLESVVFSSIASIGIGFFTKMDIISSPGYVSLGFIWLFTTTKAFNYKRIKKYEEYKNMLYLSYTVCFSILIFCLCYNLPIHNDNDIINKVIAWCWMPNLLIVFYLVNRSYK